MSDALTARDYSYESAVKALLTPGIHQATTKEDIARSARRRTRTVSDMRFYWEKILRAHPVAKTPPPNSKRPLLIHITGTKGKGSTACMCEALLREHGYSTGLFTSPHLMDIRERIRWNGKPVHERIFADVYWKIRRALESDEDDLKDCSDDDSPPILPGYFRMLTLMGLYTFLHQLSGRVDVVVLEVGMGGRYDATNFLDVSAKNFQRVSSGVTLLDLDHTRILGDTLEKIAWEKGGIFSVDKLNPSGTSERPSESSNTAPSSEVQRSDVEDFDATKVVSDVLVPKVFILDSNTEKVVAMMKNCALLEGKGGKLCLVDATGSKLKGALQNEGLSLGLAGNHQYGNAALAVALCQSVTDAVTSSKSNRIQIDSPTTLGALSSAKWPGRCQTLEWFSKDVAGKSLTFCLDGAHTPQSLEATVAWLLTKNNENTREKGKRLPILVFNCSHERNPVELLELFLRSESTSFNRWFSKVYFAKSDSSRPSPLAKASAENLLEERTIPVRSELLIGEKGTRTWQETLAIVWRHLTDKAMTGEMSDSSGSHANIYDDNDIHCNMSAHEILKDIEEQLNNTEDLNKIQVFVTGSLYLVGSFLTALEWSEDSSPDF